MKKVNVIIVYSPDERRVLMCQRANDPYKGLLNFVGGKVESGEDPLTAAYRELAEETGITDIRLTHVMNFQYFISGLELEVYAGRINKEPILHEEKNKLIWISLSEEDFSDMNRFAGECNIKHMLLQVEKNKELIL